jgi:photosystem II stability/assembly factor-like uncharacterized protein
MKDIIKFLGTIALVAVIGFSFAACGDDDGGGDDGVGEMTWTAVTNSSFSSKNINCVTIGGSLFLAVGDGTISTSSNGSTWTLRVANTHGDLNVAAYSDSGMFGKWVVAGSGGADDYMVTNDSSFSSTWTRVAKAANPFGTDAVKGIAFSGNTFVAVGGSGKIASSTNGTTWTAVETSPFGTTQINSVAYGGGKWLAAGNEGKMATSTDGTTWAAVTTSPFGTTQINSVAYGGGKWLAAGNEGKMATSTDGTTWTAVTNSAFGATQINGVAYGDTNPIRWVAVGNNGKIATSTDGGASWTAVADSKFGSSDIRGVIRGGGARWVAVGASGKMAYSDN